jgi:hypothetical protein
MGEKDEHNPSPLAGASTGLRKPAARNSTTGSGGPADISEATDRSQQPRHLKLPNEYTWAIYIVVVVSTLIVLRATVGGLGFLGGGRILRWLPYHRFHGPYHASASFLETFHLTCRPSNSGWYRSTFAPSRTAPLMYPWKEFSPPMISCLVFRDSP